MCSFITLLTNICNFFSIWVGFYFCSLVANFFEWMIADKGSHFCWQLEQQRFMEAIQKYLDNVKILPAMIMKLTKLWQYFCHKYQVVRIRDKNFQKIRINLIVHWLLRTKLFNKTFFQSLTRPLNQILSIFWASHLTQLLFDHLKCQDFRNSYDDMTTMRWY